MLEIRNEKPRFNDRSPRPGQPPRNRRLVRPRRLRHHHALALSSPTPSSPSATATAPSCWRRSPRCRAWSARRMNHLSCLRRMRDDEGWIRTLMDEAENERMHLMTFIEIAKPTWFERAGDPRRAVGFLPVFFALYLVSLAHRAPRGRLFRGRGGDQLHPLPQRDRRGPLANVPAPAIAMHYWKLPADATLRDVVLAVRADEAASPRRQSWLRRQLASGGAAAQLLHRLTSTNFWSAGPQHNKWQ